jgi:RNA polymerase sigma-70 factor, ECF subfamily
MASIKQQAQTKLEIPFLETADIQQLDDRGLVTAVKRGHAQAFRVLFERNNQRILRAAYRITHDQQDAEDALQDSFLRAYLHIKDFDGRSSFSTWLTRIAINSALMILRKKRTSREIPMEYSDASGKMLLVREPADPAPNPEHLYAQGQRRRMLRKAVGGLRPKLRRAIELSHFDECSLRQTAKAMRISTAAVKGRIFHARRSLRKSAVLKPVLESRVRRQTVGLRVAA